MTNLLGTPPMQGINIGYPIYNAVHVSYNSMFKTKENRLGMSIAKGVLLGERIEVC